MARYNLLNSTIALNGVGEGQTEYNYNVGASYPPNFLESLKFIKTMEVSLRVELVERNKKTKVIAYINNPFFKKVDMGEFYIAKYADFGSYTLNKQDYSNLKLYAKISSYRSFAIDGSYNSTYFTVKPTAINTDMLSPKNIQLSSTDIRQDIVVTWKNEEQSRCEISITQGDEEKFSKILNLENEIIIPKNTLNKGNISIKFIVSKFNIFTDRDGQSYDVNYLSKPYEFKTTLTSSEPELTEFTAINSLLNWKGANLQGSQARVEIYNLDLNNTKVADFSIPTEEFAKNKYFIPEKITLYNGNHFVKLFVNKVIDDLNYTTEMQTNMSILNRPYVKVNSLEPADVSRNFEKEIVVNWDSINQKTFNLKVFQDNQLKFEKSGTTEKTLTLPKNTLKDGTASIQLIVTNILYEILKQDIKLVSFNLYGGLKPPQITIDATSNVLNKNNLNISWNKTDLQRYYRVEFEVVRLYNVQKLDTKIVMDNGYCFDGDYLTLKEDSKIIRGSETLYKAKTILFKNDSIKNLKVTVYNELKESNSNIYKNDVYVDYEMTANTTITAYTQGDKIVINSVANNLENVDFRLMRGTDERYTQYKEIFKTTQSNFVYEDKNVKSNTRYYYYVITTNNDKSIASNIVTEKVQIQGFIFTNLDTNESKNLNLEVSADFTTNDGKVIVEFLGKSTADIEKDGREYQICTFSCLINKNDLPEINKLFIADKVAYRDRKGNAFICNLKNKKISYNDKFDDYLRLSFDMIENDSLKQFE